MPADYPQGEVFLVIDDHLLPDVGIGVKVAGHDVRFRLTRDNAQWLVRTIRRLYLRRKKRSQSPISSGSPSTDGSPQEGQSVCPPAKSSSTRAA